MNIITQFACDNVIISKAIEKLMEIEHKAPNTFRLSVETPDDTVPPGTGQYRVEAPIMLALLDTAYAEIVSCATRTTRKDAQIALADRHRYASGWDDVYDGGDPDETQEDIENRLVEAVDRAEVILRYAKHIAAVKDGGAEWLAGFEVNKWVPAKGHEKDEDILRACATEVGLAEYIKLGKVSKIQSVVDNRLVNFTEWCDIQLRRKGVSEQWRNKVAEARVCGIVLSDIPVNTACEYIGDIVLGHAFNRNTTRLEDAVTRVANTYYIRLAYTIQNNIAAQQPNRMEIDKAFKKAFEFLPYSTMLQDDIKTVKASDEWADHQLMLDIEANKKAAQESLRQAMREQVMFDIEKQALEVAAMMKQANELRALIAKQREELLNPKAKITEPKKDEQQAEKRKAAAIKAAATRKAKAEAKKAAEEALNKVKGVHKSSNMPKLNINGVR